jgi:hypothetical protein
VVTVGLVVIGLLLVGLPLLALSADRVLPQPRSRPMPPSREPVEIVRSEFGLGWQDHLEVVAAVQEGRVVARPELRPAASRLAELVLHPPRPTFRGRPVHEYPRWQRITVVTVFVAFAIVYLYVVLAQAHVGFFATYFVIYGLFLVGAGIVRRHRRRRAAEAVTANR